MKDYKFYKQNNKELYDPENTNITDIKPKEAILLSCISCRETYSDAYKCNNMSCPLFYLKKEWMKRPHTASEWFLANRKSPKWMKK